MDVEVLFDDSWSEELNRQRIEKDGPLVLRLGFLFKLAVEVEEHTVYSEL